MPTFAHQLKGIGAQMAESVDALVSNTSRFTPVPVRPRLWVLKERTCKFSLFFVQLCACRVWGRSACGGSADLSASVVIASIGNRCAIIL